MQYMYMCMATAASSLNSCKINIAVVFPAHSVISSIDTSTSYEYGDRPKTLFAGLSAAFLAT